jgi:hypothetical protein
MLVVCSSESREDCQGKFVVNELHFHLLRPQITSPKLQLSNARKEHPFRIPYSVQRLQSTRLPECVFG